MHVIVGIGNPGAKYKSNRHNVGFQFLDYFAEKKSLNFKASKYNYFYSEGEFSAKPFVLVKPDTYVNLSGSAVLNCAKYYSVDLKDILVVVDDINLDIATIRIRKSGGDGGHNGLNSIIYHLNSNEFPRLRIGIGNNFSKGSLPDYVLSDFNKDDFLKLNITFDLSIKLLDSFLLDGYQTMHNTFSRLKNLKHTN
ncbi:MAG: aminoacyl-tRNA hydrolase [Ignavibacteriaceae bacterium]